MRTDCGKTKRTRRYFMNDAFIISSKFQNLFCFFSKTLVRMFNGYPKSSARSRCHFHEKTKNNRQKSPKIFTHTLLDLYVSREKRTTFKQIEPRFRQTELFTFRVCFCIPTHQFKYTI